MTIPADQLTQDMISAEISRIHAEHVQSSRAAGSPGPVHPPRDFSAYRSTLLRHPTHELVRADPEGIELASPAFGHTDVAVEESDLTIQHSGEPLGERIIVTGRVLDGDGRPVRNQLVEIWQANGSGRYVHKRDQHPAPLDPNFTGVGRLITGDDGSYRLTTIKPGAYPWKNHRNAWRPAHIHFSFFGSAFTQRLITQMYFPGDPLFGLDPIYQSIVDPAARERLVACYDHEVSEPEWAIGYRWDVVLTGPRSTWMEPEDADHA
ncbi:protocatechuate 3,4-dioxygenase subunit beta [Leifsonia sp. Leaf264]|uniref:protocatechuate 3,4-dioxygenase subunit beta n=1 Tax=Leifsonia sp. Leaf264 TaxID=1736314 RepID=UPI0006F3B59C|nr:protocatechuate 3,4-dioxygenase subunit beta [Leifsonia sp. Leaf264]KQP01838.1 protocatechuate 3,4-dioxygenase subunit beta [Leifsonia sp. Leaf264]